MIYFPYFLSFLAYLITLRWGNKGIFNHWKLSLIQFVFVTGSSVPVTGPPLAQLQLHWHCRQVAAILKPTHQGTGKA
jgi:hypothetical protein